MDSDDELPLIQRARAVRLAHHPFDLSIFSRNGEDLNTALKATGPDAQLYLQSIRDFERAIFLKVDANGVLLREVVGLDLPALPPLSSTSTRKNYILCKVISAYRLVEELMYLSDVPNSLVAPRLARQVCEKPMKHFDKLNDIASLVADFSKAVNKVSNFRIDSHKEAGALAHLITLFQLRRATDAGKILMNLAVAALHLAYVLETPFHGKLPDLPDSADEYIASLKGLVNGSQVPDFPDLVMFLKNIYPSGPDTTSINLRSPLQLALMISPMFLLVPIEIHMKKWNRGEINRMANLMGNEHPTELVKAERLVFKTIYRLARHETDVGAAAVQLSNDLSETSSIILNNHQARYWFDMSKPLSPFPTINGSGHPRHSMDALAPELINTVEIGSLNKLIDIHSGPELALSHEPHHAVSTDLSSELCEPNKYNTEAHHQGMNSDIDSFGMTALSGVDELAKSHGEDGPTDGQTNTIQHSSNCEDNSGLDDEDENHGSKKRGIEAEAGIIQDDDGEDEIGEGNDSEDEIEEDHDDHMSSYFSIVEASGKKSISNSPVLNKGLRKRKRKSKEHASKEQPGGLSFKSVPSRPVKRRKDTTDPPSLLTASTSPESFIVIDYNSEDDQAVPENSKKNNQLELAPVPPKYRSKKKYTLYGPTDKTMISFSPVSHSKTELRCQENLLQAVVDSYVDGKPLHLINRAESAFHVLAETEFEDKSVEEVQHIFSRQNMVAHNIPLKEPIKFDEAGFYSLVPYLDEKIDIQDQSVQPKQGDYNDRLKRGTPRQMLQAHRQDGKILNALNFPGTRLTLPDLPLSSDLVAWELTRYRRMSEEEDYPIQDMRWFLATLESGSHTWHIDSDGAATFIVVETGAKCWIVGYRKEGHSEESFSDIDFFLPPNFSITNVCAEKWRLEAVILQPGSRLMLRPNTPHAVITTDSSFCSGGHYYSISTMQSTAAGLMHAFITGSVTTNTNHDPTRFILRRMSELCYLVFVRKRLQDYPRALAHVPSLTSLDGVLNLLSLCNLVIFSNVLDGRTYLGWEQDPYQKCTKKQIHDIQVYDRNALEFKDREKYRHARGMAFQILYWFAASFEVTTRSTTGKAVQIDVLGDLVFAYLIQQGRALLAYKQMADNHHILGFPGCTLKELDTQLNAVFRLHDKLHHYWIASASDHDNPKFRKLLWGGCRDLTFKQKDASGSSLPAEFKIVDFSQGGTTALDKCFLKGYTNGFKENL